MEEENTDIEVVEEEKSEFSYEDYLNSLPEGVRNDLLIGGKTSSPLTDAALIASPLLAKPALLKTAIVGTGNLIKNHPWKAFDTLMTGLGAADTIENPENIALETTAMKTDLWFNRTQGLKYLASKIDDWIDNPKYSQFTLGWEGNRLGNNIDGFNPANPMLSKSDDLTSGQNFTNITKNNLKLFNQIGWTDTAKLDIQEMLYGVDEVGKPILSNYKRRLLKASIADPGFDFKHFREHRPEIVRDFLEGLEDLNINPKTIHAHHISGLRVTSSLFDGLSPIQRKKLIRIFQEEGLALGNNPKNLMALHSSTHLDVVHPFLESQIGKYGQLLIDPAKIKNMSPRQREVVVREFARVIKESERIAFENTRKWLDDAYTGVAPEAAFEAKWDMLQESFRVQEEIRKQQLIELREAILLDKVKNNLSIKQLRKKYGNNFDIIQLDLFDLPK